MKAKSENLLRELNQVKKTLTISDKEQIRHCHKIDNLEDAVKNLKDEKKSLVVEKNKAIKENARTQKEILKLKERRSSSSKSTTTSPVYSSEASTSTVAKSSSDGTSNTSPVNTISKITQTFHHPDVPYKIEMPLPPIFSSCLVHKTNPIHFLSRSHPNLATIKWTKFTEDDLIEEQISEIEMENYGTEVKEFFEEAAEKAKALREIYEESLIEKLFEEI